MDISEAGIVDQPIVSVGADPLPSTSYLVLGGVAPALPGTTFRTAPGSRCAGILLVGPVSSAQFTELLSDLPNFETGTLRSGLFQ